jgi:hypothetical protein
LVVMMALLVGKMATVWHPVAAQFRVEQQVLAEHPIRLAQADLSP